VRQAAYAVVEALFRVLFTYECFGEEHVPARGGAVVAANHPSYLDPILLSLQVRRPIRFMTWEGLFRVPLLGALLRGFGAFPVNTRPGHGREAYGRARAMVEAGQVVGIFPEGRRSRAGWMEGSLREGAARLSLETGAPLVPATITGAFRAWPYFRALPRPARVRVRFHPPIDPAPWQGRPEEEALSGLLGELRRRVERSLLPGVKADLRFAVLYRARPPWPRLVEVLPALGAAAILGTRRGPGGLIVPLAYLVYLLLDRLVIPPSRLAKWARNGSALLFVLAIAPAVFRALALPPIPAPGALAAVVLGASFPYLYARGPVALGFVRGLVGAALAELAAQAVSPLAAGPHLALTAFAALYAWDRRTVFWRYAVPVLAAYAAGVTWLLGGGGGVALATHGVAALVGWVAGRMLPYHRAARGPSYPVVAMGAPGSRPRPDSEIHAP
jgi:1-acyl-sn-glycerol-3-phosphate acyltransferase